jgi:hypothetical protein
MILISEETHGNFLSNNFIISIFELEVFGFVSHFYIYLYMENSNFPGIFANSLIFPLDLVLVIGDSFKIEISWLFGIRSTEQNHAQGEVRDKCDGNHETTLQHHS